MDLATLKLILDVAIIPIAIFAYKVMTNLESIKKQQEKIMELLSHHDHELIRNTEQHNAIVKALEGHVSDNKQHDSEVKQILAVIKDRLDRK